MASIPERVDAILRPFEKGVQLPIKELVKIQKDLEEPERLKNKIYSWQNCPKL